MSRKQKPIIYFLLAACLAATVPLQAQDIPDAGASLMPEALVMEFLGCGDGTCTAGEDCNSCPTDCPSFMVSGAVCGNGVCEAGNGEDCVSCAADCAGSQGGKPSARFCCGDGDGDNPIRCNDARCDRDDARACTELPAPEFLTCCGDLTCESPEDTANCAADCSAPNAPAVTIVGIPAQTVIGDTISLSADASPVGGTLEWHVVNAGAGTFSDPGAADTSLTVDDRSVAYDGSDGPNIAVNAVYTVTDPTTGLPVTVEDFVKVPVDLDNPLVPFVREIRYTVDENPGAKFPMPGQTVTFDATITPPAGLGVESITISPSQFLVPIQNGHFTVPITITALLDGGVLFSWDTFATVLTDIYHSIRIHLVLLEFDLYCLLFPNSEFCDVWTKAKEHLFGPGGNGVGSDGMREGWLAWADANTIRIHADGWDHLGGNKPIKDKLKGGEVNCVPPSLKEFLVHEMRHVWQDWQLAMGNPIPDGGDAEVDARWFSKKWSEWTLLDFVQAYLDELLNLLTAIGDAVSGAIDALEDILLSSPFGENFTPEVQSMALSELEALRGSEMITEDQIPQTIAAWEALFLDNPPPQCPEGKTLEGPFKVTNDTGGAKTSVKVTFAGTGGSLMMADLTAKPKDAELLSIMADSNMVTVSFAKGDIATGESVEFTVCSEFWPIDEAGTEWTE